MDQKAKKPDQAQVVYKTLLDEVGEYLLADQFEKFADRLHLPHFVRTRSARCKIETKDELREHFNALRATLISQNIEHYIRVPYWAKFLSKDEIIGRHVTHIMRMDATRIVPPYSSHMKLQRGADGKWRASELVSSISNTKWPIGLARVAPDAAESRIES